MRFRKYRIKCFGQYDRIAIQCAFCSRRVKCEAATPSAAKEAAKA